MGKSSLPYIKTGSTSYIILTILEKAVDGFLKIQDFRQYSGAYLYGNGRDLPKSALSQAIKRLKEGGFVQEAESLDHEIIYKLTEKGRSLIEPSEPENWDGKYRIVIFDIPEEKRLIRGLFRRNLKKWGFKPLQKSAWISKKDVFAKLSIYIKNLKISQWVIIIESDKLSNYHNM